MKQHNLWLALQQLPSSEAVLAEWKIMLGPDFTNAQPFLHPTTQQSILYPCTAPHPCGCYHERIHHADHLVAVCRCEPAECDNIEIQPKDLKIHILDLKKFTKALQDVFGFDASNNGTTAFPAAPSAWPIGTYKDNNTSVYFLTRLSEDEFIKELEGLASAEHSPFILLTPTNQFKTPTIQMILQRQKAIMIPLEPYLSFKSPGKFTVIQSIQPILEQFKQGLTGHQESVETKSHLKKRILYEITFNAMRGEILLNGKTRLSKPNLGSENEAVIQYLITNPNKKITKREIESKMETKIGKDFHKIVENLGFTGNLRKTFFKTSASHIIFRNPITENAFKELGIPALKVKK